MIEDMIFKSFFMKNYQIQLEFNKYKVNPIEKSSNNNLMKKNNDSNLHKNKSEDDIYIEEILERNSCFMIIDTCEISDEARRLYSLAKQEVDNSPDVRLDKVEAIKSKINQGSYNVEIEDLSEKLMNNKKRDA